MAIINRLSNLPYYFFIFISSFILIEFIFIFFLNASYTPRIIFDLTPFHIIEGISDLQLLFLSLIFCLINTYFHTKEEKHFLLYSFFLTGMMIAGLSTAIITQNLSVDYVPHYLVFGLLIFIVPLDHNKYLAITKPKDQTQMQLPYIPSKKSDKILSALRIDLPQIFTHNIPKRNNIPLSTSNNQLNFVTQSNSKNKIMEIYEKLDNLALPKKMKTQNTQTLYSCSSKIEKSFDLLMLSDMKPKYADILVECGVNTIHNLASSDAADLFKNIEMHLIISEENIEISYNMVSQWINQAKEILSKK